MSVYYRWTKARSYTLKTISVVVFTIILLTVYTTLGMIGVINQTVDQVGDTVGYMMTAGCLLPYAGPLETIRTVVKTRSGASIPFGMCLAGGISNALWVLEGYLVNDLFMIYLSTACSAMGFLQVTLYLIYRPGRYTQYTDVQIGTQALADTKMSVGLVIIQALASIFSVAMILSSAPDIYCIHKRQDTGEVALFPLVGLWLNCHMLMLYGLATADYFPLFATYLFGDVMSIVYIVVFFRWTKARAYAVKAIGATFVIVALAAAYTILGMAGVTGQSTDGVGLVTGYMMAVGSVLLYVAPFETIKTVLKTRSGASIPFGMCLAGATSNVLWVVNGLLTDDTFIFFLGAVCSVLGLAQVVLYLIFRPTHKSSSSEIVIGQTKQNKSVLPMTVSSLRSDSTLDTLPSPVFIAVHSP
ncbi:hypothetical protein BBO99_00007967 [Phytophthora kernoviae]|uniref:MtN3-like protein n=2 Tax=Phytophthora kernoviae TaxID=325452 RepID=A0A3R7J7D2_9STRA|nr:hypothetical protein G195_008448 [Phytophthora kernoviae 00238/432]KAG2516823.1 hypothetical protein JM16_007550 [Phytophthora kernoviae]KAG2519813.1 hypothetical protein JM18_007074 [Phytophthora kernoviae]RLN32498.1 hypothetical protein BBI17_007780 [Phytophthora kernoviae]RLN75915.1 hypothetical protein BBO99_00007967 [Phytophthora kernoviae]